MSALICLKDNNNNNNNNKNNAFNFVIKKNNQNLQV